MDPTYLMHICTIIIDRNCLLILILHQIKSNRTQTSSQTSLYEIKTPHFTLTHLLVSLFKLRVHVN